MSLSRRHFLQTTAATTTLSALCPIEYVQAQQQPRSKSPGEKIGVAVIGVRGQGRSHIADLLKLDDAEILYIADCDENFGRQRAEEVGQKQGRKPQFVQDFRKCLEDPALDAISTATPNHWHALISIWAMQAGKDVYVEKPVSHNVWEGRQMVNAARSLNRICQTGTQSRSSGSLHEAVKWVHEGHLGKIQYAIGTCYKPRKSIGKSDTPLKIPASLDYDLWCGPAAKVELYRPQKASQAEYNPHYDWHWDHNTGNGDMGNQGIHQMDIARWFLGENELSPQVMSIGGRVGYEDAGNTPNTQIVYHLYPKAPLIFETRGLPKSKQEYDSGSYQMDEYRGSKVGVIVQCENGHMVIPSYSSCAAFDGDGNKVKEWRGGGNHFANFLDAVRSRNYNDLNADILEGHLSSALCHTGMISHHVGEKRTRKEIEKAIEDDALLADSFTRMADHLLANGVDIDSPTLTLGPHLTMDQKAETFERSDANPWLTREYRQGFEVPAMQV
jgi:predicted dehydrogenase